MSELWAALAGAGAGGVLTLLGTWLQARLSRKHAKEQAIHEARLGLVRELMRNRAVTSSLAEPLNEVPILFSGDEEVIKAYRRLADAGSGGDAATALRAMIVLLAERVNLEPIQEIDIYRFIQGGKHELP